jgi:hypothetical protein
VRENQVLHRPQPRNHHHLVDHQGELATGPLGDPLTEPLDFSVVRLVNGAVAERLQLVALGIGRECDQPQSLLRRSTTQQFSDRRLRLAQ